MENGLIEKGNIENINVSIFDDNGNVPLMDTQKATSLKPIDATNQPDVAPVKFVPSQERLDRFLGYVSSIDASESEDITQAKILNAISEISPDIADVVRIAPEEALSIFFGDEDAKSVGKMVEYLKKAYDLNAGSLLEKQKFDFMNDDQQRAFIEDLRKEDLKVYEERYVSKNAVGSPYSQVSKEKVFTGNYNKMTDEQYAKWKQEFIDDRKYAQFWNVANNIGMDNMRLAYALSMAKDDGDVKAYLPELQKLTPEQRVGVYWAAHEFMPENSYWWSILDRQVEGLSDAGILIGDILSGRATETSASKLAEHIDSNGGWEAVLKNPELIKGYFTWQKVDNPYVDESGFVYSGGNKLLKGDFYARDDSDMLNKAKAIYEVGKKQIDTKNILRDIEKATAPKYASEGYVVDKIIDGLSIGVDVGKFVLPGVVLSSASNIVGTAARISKIASVAKDVASAEKAVQLAERAKTLAKVADTTGNIAWYLSHASKLVQPYFWARMTHDLAEQAHEAGLTEEQSFVLGAVGGFVNSLLEKLQVNLYMKNPLLAEKVINAIVNKKGWFRTVSSKHIIDGIKSRGATFGKEFLIENLQNFNDAIALQIGASLTGKEAEDFNLVCERLVQDAKDLIIPLTTSTLLLGSEGENRGYMQNVARAYLFSKAPELMYRYQGAVHMQEAVDKMEKSGLEGLSIDDAIAYDQAMTQDEKDAILAKVEEKKRPLAQKVLEETNEDLKNASAKLYKAVKSEISQAEQVQLPATKEAKLERTQADIDHEKNQSFIKGFVDLLKIQDEVVYMDTPSSDAELESAIVADLKNKGYGEREIQRFKQGKLVEGMRYNGKIYLFGNLLKTPKRTLEVLKHEAQHRGIEAIRDDISFKKFLDDLLDSAGGEGLVRQAMADVKNIKVVGDRYEVGEEYLCVLAEKVLAQNEMSESEQKSWRRIVNFFSEIIADLPKDQVQRNRRVANIIRAIWSQEYFEEPPEFAFDYEEESGLTQVEQTEAQEEQPIAKEVSPERKQKAKQDFRRKITKSKYANKKMSEEEKELVEEKQRIADWLNSIPNEDAIAKLEAISTIENPDLIETDILQWGAEMGDKYCESLLEERLQAQQKKEALEQGKSLLDVMFEAGLKLPTPKAILKYADENNISRSGFLFGEIKDLYMSLSFGQRQKYFSSKYTSLDEIAQILNKEHGFKYEGEADFISDFAENVWKKAETKRYSFADRDLDAESQRQYDEVVAKYKDTEQWMKAPNGKPTNLTERQWVMVRTPNFKNWFGDWENDPQNASKVVDENGEPLVVYHGTNEYEVKKTWNDKTRTYDNEYKKFTIFKSKLGNFFNSSIDNAGGYGLEVYKTFLNIKNPLVIDAKNAHFSEVEFEGETKGTYDWVKEAKSKGFDGVIFNNIRDGIDYGAISVSTNDYVAFNSNQIKSATDNIGTYDNANDDIRFSFIETRAQEELDELNKKHRDLYERYKNGDQEAYKQAVELTKAEAERKGSAVEVYHGTGADRFNVADATSKHEENGEGNQAHGAGLYMAVSRDTARGYRNAFSATRTIGVKDLNNQQLLEKLKKDVGYSNVDDLKNDLKIGLKVIFPYTSDEAVVELANQFIEAREKYIKDIEDFIKEIELDKSKSYYTDTEETKERRVKEAQKSIDGFVEQIKEAEKEIENIKSYASRPQLVRKLQKHQYVQSGYLFDWFTNLNEDNTLDENKSITEQNKDVLKKLRDAVYEVKGKENGKDSLDYMVRNKWDGEDVYDYFVDILGSKLKASQHLLKHGIKGLTYYGQRDGRCYVSFEGGATVKLQDPFTFDDNGELIPLSERFNENNPDMRFSIVEKQIETPQFKEWFGNSKVVDENGKPLHVYHGTSRGDRVGDIFDPKRSTSGPMAFFTDNKEIATNYATGKIDTSIEKEGLLDSFDNRFVFTLDTGRKIPFTKAWGFIPFAKRREIIEKAKHITLDDEAENIIYDENANNGLGQFSYHLKYARDNAFQALVDEWLESGTLMREDEARFLQVLKLVGIENVEFLDPYKKDIKVFDVFLRIENPFDTSNIKKTDIAGIKRAAKKAQKNYNPDEATNVDMWDKSAISPEEWIEKFESDLESGKTYAWTQIPDFVSDYLKSKGYDGIKDSGGKFTNVGHTVWIPFSSVQIKDATGENSGDFSLDNPSIYFSFATLEKLKNATPIVVGKNDYKGKYELNAKSAFDYVMKNLRGIKYTIEDTDEYVEIGQIGAKKISSHNRYDEDYLRSFVVIPEIISKGIFLGERPNEKNDKKFDKYRYYACGLKIGETDYTVRFTIGLRDGNWYYDQALTKIEKGKLIDLVRKQTSLSSHQGFPNGVIDNRLISLLQENNSENVKFSFADNNIHERKRKYAQKLAKKLYSRIGKGWDASNPLKPTEYPQPTQEDKDDIATQEMDFLDEDIEFVCDRAEAILAKMISGTGKRNVVDAVPEIEYDLEKQRIYDAVIKDALKEYKKATDIQEKAKKQIQRDLDKKIKAVKGFGLDELAINGIDLAEAVAGFNPNDIEEAIDNIVAYCKQWATREGVSYELAFAKIQATFTKSFEDLTSQFVYGKHIKSAMKAIAKLSTKTTEESLIKNAKNLAKRFAEFLQKETADFAKKKLKKEAEKTEKRLNELKAKAVKIIVDFANDQKLPKANVLDIKREIPARVQAYLAQIKKVITLSEEEVKAQYQQLSQKAGANDENGEEAFNYKDRFRMSALMTFGNIKEKSLAEILSAYNELKKLIQGEKDKQLERIEKMEEEAAAMVEPLVDALKKRGNLKDATENIFKAGIKGGSMYNHALENVFLSGKGMSKPLQKDVKSLIERYTTEISHASLKKRNFVETKMQWLRDIVAECYGSYAKGLERLTRFDEKLSRFAKDEGDNLSIARLMNIYCAMQQWHVKQAYKNAKNKKTSDGEKIDYTFEKRLRYWENLYKNEAEIEKVFTDADKKFIEALKGEYAKRFQQVNSIYEKLNGLPMVSYDGANYMPIKRDMGVGLGGKAGRYIRIFPRYYAPRIVSLRELDEQESILDIFNDRVQTDAHFINFAEIAFKYLSAMENDEFNDALKRHTIGSERDKLLTFTRHILNGEIESEYKGVESLMIRLSASVGLGMNLPSQFKQFSGVGAFMLEQSIPDFVKGFVGTIATPEGWESIKELWSSPYLADRRNSGQINWVLSEFEKQADSLKNISSAKIAFKNVLSKAMFGGLKYMDSVASVVGGASLYRAKKEQYMQTMPVEKAKELATLDVVAVAERTQQSSLIMNMGEIQRNKGAFGKMFTMFRTTNQQFLSYETNAITKVVANPTTENVMNLARTLVANHLISPIFFNSLGLLAELILGDDLDEDDWELFLKNIAVSVFLDVFTGWYITGIAKDVLAGVILGGFHSNKSLADSMLPAGAVARVVEASMRLMRDLADGNGDFEFWKHIDRMLKTALPIWRTGRKIYDNATDDKDSVLYSWAFK